LRIGLLLQGLLAAAGLLSGLGLGLWAFGFDWVAILPELPSLAGPMGRLLADGPKLSELLAVACVAAAAFLFLHELALGRRERRRADAARSDPVTE
jgi:hypothetical protein